MRKLVFRAAFGAVLGVALGQSGDAWAAFEYAFDTAALEHYYPFDGDALDAAGDVDMDVSGNPTFETSTAPAAGAGQALVLGGDDWLRGQGPSDFAASNDGDYTISLWLKTSSATTQDAFSATDLNSTLLHGILIEVESNGRVRFLHRPNFGLGGGTDLRSLTPVNDGAWHHVVVRRDGESLELFIDGESERVDSDSDDISRNLRWIVGRLRTSAIREFIGQIDDLRLYGSALDDEEVMQLFESETFSKIISHGPDEPESLDPVNLLAGRNFSFEAPEIISAAEGQSLVNGDLDDWLVVSGNVDLHNAGLNAPAAHAPADDGSQYVELNGDMQGGIVSSTFPTTNGSDYRLSFALSGQLAEVCSPALTAVADADDADRKVKVSILNADDSEIASREFAFSVAEENATADDAKWRDESLAFSAASAATRVKFESLTGELCGALIDNVRVGEASDLSDGAVDLVVEAPQSKSLYYAFAITVNTALVEGGTVYDVIPAEWDVFKVNEEMVGSVDLDDPALPAGGEGNGAGNVSVAAMYMAGDEFDRLECGESGTFNADDSIDGEVTLSRGGRDKKPKGRAPRLRGDACQSDTRLEWALPEAPGVYRLTVHLQSRAKNVGKPYFSPASCGALLVNDGAYVSGAGSPYTDRLIVAAVEDVNRDGRIVRDGSGDEDDDGLTDIEEVRDYGTNPCEYDTDRDGIEDGADLCPTQGLPDAFEVLGTDGCVLPDRDGDGVADVEDSNPDDPSET